MIYILSNCKSYIFCYMLWLVSLDLCQLVTKITKLLLLALSSICKDIVLVWMIRSTSQLCAASFTFAALQKTAKGQQIDEQTNKAKQKKKEREESFEKSREKKDGQAVSISSGNPYFSPCFDAPGSLSMFMLGLLDLA